jgi:hypothetical protein
MTTIRDFVTVSRIFGTGDDVPATCARDGERIETSARL